jgi:hypothetical protein
MAKLESCTIKFYTNGAAKKADTRLTVTVRDDSDIVSASISNGFGQFEEHSNNGPFDLAVLHPTRKADLRGGNVTLRLEPAEDDTWRFNFFTVFAFSDGTRLSGGETELELNRGRNELTFLLDTIVR